MMKWIDVGKKPSKAGFKKVLQGKVSLATCLGGLSLFLGLRLDLPDFAKGFLMGLAIACSFASLHFSAILRHAHKFNDYYVNYYDERNQRNRRLAMQLTSWLVVAVLIGLTLLYAFWQFELPYIVLLVGLLYTVLLGLLVFTFILGRWF